MSKLLKTLTILILASFLLLGCSAEDPTPNKPEDNPTGQVEDGNKVEDSDEKDDEVVFTGNKEIKSKVLRDLISSKRYTMKMRQVMESDFINMESTITTAVDGDQTYTKVESGDNVLEFIEQDNYSYLIMRDDKTIIKSDRYDDEDESELNDGTVVYDDLIYVGEGKEDFLGKNLAYEEYKTEFGKVKYYFDGKNLAGMTMNIDMENIMDDEDFDEEDEFDMGTVEMTMEIISFDKKVDKSLFELPKDFNVIGD